MPAPSGAIASLSGLGLVQAYYEDPTQVLGGYACTRFCHRHPSTLAKTKTQAESRTSRSSDRRSFCGNWNTFLLFSKTEFALSQSQNTTLNASLFRLGTSATTASDRFIYDQTTGNLFFDADGIGKAAQVQIAQFSNQAVLSSANITVIV
ncbi:hypothetical protein [uncultured Nostoc sp.]|uniref:hypothetical protein n=1 Tax=uncultured Nostoc sp. TaxID=340711 RepID=UPI0035CB3DA0